jgi:phosphate-selective porin OprO/OprP
VPVVRDRLAEHQAKGWTVRRVTWLVSILFAATCSRLIHSTAVGAEPSAVVIPGETIAPTEYQTESDAPMAPLPAIEGEVASAARVNELEARIGELEAALAGQQAAPAPAEEDGNKMSSEWGKDGFTATSANENFKVHIGGRVQLDAVALNTDDLVLGGVGDADAVDFRRARLRIDGTMYQTMDWAAEFDFVNGADFDPTNGASPITYFGGDVGHVVAPTDLWWTFHEVPWAGHVRIGNQKEAIGLEHMASSRFLDFMERSYLQDAFYGPFNNGFTPGISLFNYNEAETVTWNLGGYKNTQNVFAYDTGDNEYAMTGRMTCVPYADCDDRYLVHMGLGASYRGLDQDASTATGNVRLRSRASLRNGPGPLNPNLADTNFAGRLFAENETLLAPEIAVVSGPWFASAEYVSGFINSTTFTPIAGAPTALGQVYFQGSYCEVLYFLTGEHRVYDRHEARFTRVSPNNNLTLTPCGIGSLGAWQVGARYGFLDLRDAGIDGGYIQDLTLGLNWFLNPHSKVQFNYILQHVDNTQRNGAGAVTAVNDGDLQGFGVRFAQDF